MWQLSLGRPPGEEPQPDGPAAVVFLDLRHRGDIERATLDIGATLHGAWGQLELAGRSLAFTHGDDRRLLHDLEHADAFDFLFHGHTHIAQEHRTGNTRVINPGALQRVARRTFLVLDLPSGEVESVEVE